MPGLDGRNRPGLPAVRHGHHGRAPRRHLAGGVPAVRDERAAAAPHDPAPAARPHRRHPAGLAHAAGDGGRQRRRARPPRGGDLAAAATGRNRRSSSSRTTPRTAPITWTRTARSCSWRARSSSAGIVDSTLYTTSSVLRTIELILGLPPMSQYDAAATPMYNAFADDAGHARPTALPARGFRSTRATRRRPGAAASLAHGLRRARPRAGPRAERDHLEGDAGRPLADAAAAPHGIRAGDRQGRGVVGSEAVGSRTGVPPVGGQAGNHRAEALCLPKILGCAAAETVGRESSEGAGLQACFKEALMNRLLRGALAAIVIAVLLGATLWAVTAPKVQFTDTKLKNGLRVIIAEDHTAPVYSIAVTYNVGSRNERKGRTGFAHLFEHMMFKGSENVGSGEHFMLVFNNGGNMNGTTNKDRTNYFETLPANQLDLGLFLEADRMRSLAAHHQGEPREPDRHGAGRAAPGRRQPALRQDRRGARRPRVRELRLQALGDRLDGGPERRHGRGRPGVLPDLLRAEQRRHRDRRRREARRSASRRCGSTSSPSPRRRRRPSRT